MEYSKYITALAKHTQDWERSSPLLSEACQSVFLFHPQPTQRVCLFFHGFTAAPHQFQPMAEQFFRAGYNVLVPLLPGHGQAGNWSSHNPPPLPNQAVIYQEFALLWLEHARSLGTEVVVGGLSGGGTLAAWLALECPELIHRTLLFAPYLSSSSRLVDLMVRSMNSYFEWLGGAPSQVPMGYEGFAVPALRVFLDLGQAVLTRAQQQPTAPMFIVSSESDIAVGNHDHRALFEAVLSRQPLAWYQCFARALNVPHTMMTEREGNRWQNLLNVMAKAFVESELTWTEVQEIGYRMTEGRTFDAVVADLNLAAKASPDMPAMMTMVDKRAIALERQALVCDSY